MHLPLALGLLALGFLPLLAAGWCSRCERLIRSGRRARVNPLVHFLGIQAAVTALAILPMFCLVLAQEEVPSLLSLRFAVISLVFATGFYGFYRAIRLYLLESIQAGGQQPSAKLLRRSALGWLVLMASLSAVASLVSQLLAWIPGFPPDFGFRLIIGVVTATILVALWFPKILRRLAPSRALPPGTLLQKTRALSQRAGLRMPKILILEEGELSQPPNALVAGPTIRSCTIFLTERLLRDFAEEEVLAVVAHELGHARLGHLKRYVGASVVSILVAWGAGATIPGLAEELRPIVQSFLYLTLCAMACRWIMRRAEFEADRFGAELIGSSQALISALQRIELANSARGSGLNSGSLSKRLAALFRTHPSTEERVAALELLSGARGPS